MARMTNGVRREAHGVGPNSKTEPDLGSTDSATSGDYGKYERPEVKPIAIVGMSCRLPGDVTSLESFWELCARAQSAWTEIPKDRFNPAAFYHPNPDKIGCFNVKGGHFLNEDPTLFDAPFFNITAAEAKALDPQHRIMLECTYEAIENAGIPKASIAGQNVGVFVGGSMADYDMHIYSDTNTLPMFHATGTAASMLSNRVSYYFDLRGPSITVDTACSSSLSALHLAAQSLRSREITQAIVGGCHLNLLPGRTISMSTSNLLSDSGKSIPFDERGTGFGKGEGAGCIILKNLDDAISAGDSIRAVIMGTGMNQDGRTPGITMPSRLAQEDLIRHVYESASLDPRDTGFVEGHGTGTKVGDPIEAAALHAVFGEGRTPKAPLFLGSVKSNIGHLEGVSGIVSVIKAALMLERGFILPNSNFEKPNPSIPLSDWNMKILTTPVPWPRNKRYVSVNNFGWGGANAHAVLGKAPRRMARLADKGNLQRMRVYVLSANDQSAVKAQIRNLSTWLEHRPDAFEKHIRSSLAFTLAERRSLLPWRVAMPAVNSHDLVKKLAGAKVEPVRVAEEPSIGFVFTGQGAQCYAMGRELMQIFPVYESTMKAADQYLLSQGAPFSLLSELSKDAEDSVLETAQISQPACTALQIALTALLKSWGVCPKAVIGHSSGEIAAAYAAGFLTMEQAMRVAYHRGTAATLLKKKFPNLKGGMLAVGASAEEVRPLLKTLRDGQATIACINSPSSTTVSGDDQAILELQTLIEAQNLFNRKLRVEVAYHSQHMRLVADDYHSSIGDVRPHVPHIPDTTFYSALTGGKIDPLALTADYWRDNLTNPVLFSAAFHDLCRLNEDRNTLSNDRIDMLIEIGPHSALEGPVKQILKAASTTSGVLPKVQYTTTLIRNRNAVETMLELASTLFMRGSCLNFAAINFTHQSQDKPTLIHDLHRYPWQHSTRYWHGPRASQNYLNRPFPRSDYIGNLADSSNPIEPTWTNIMRLQDMPWMKHHQMQSLTVFPFAGYIAMAMEASAQRANLRHVEFDKFAFKDISVKVALAIPEDSEVETMSQLRAYGDGMWDEFRVFATINGKDWKEHCHGLVSVQNSSTVNVVDGAYQEDNARLVYTKQLSSMTAECTSEVNPEEMYETLQNAGVGYGRIFQGLSDIRLCKYQHSIADLEVPHTADIMPFGYEHDFIIHPATLDLCIQITWPILGAGQSDFHRLYMPTFLKEASIPCNITKQAGDRLRVHGSSSCPVIPTPPRPENFSIYASASDAEPLIALEGLVMTPVQDEMDTTQLERELCFKLGWEPLGSKKAKDVMSNGHAPEALLDGEVVIICGDSQQRHFASRLSDLVRCLSGRSPSVGSLTDVDAEGKICIFLLELDEPFIGNMSEETFTQTQKLITTAKGILWVVRSSISMSPEADLILGLSRSIRSETTLPFVTLQLDPQQKVDSHEDVEMVYKVFEHSFAAGATNCEKEYVEKNGQLHVPRVINDSEMNKVVHQITQVKAPGFQSVTVQNFVQEERPLKLVTQASGSLDTLYFTDDEAFPSLLAEHDVVIEVKAAGFNFKDVMIAMGQLPIDRLGQECSGLIIDLGKAVSGFAIGDRVAAMAHGTFSTHARCPATSVSKIPDSMSFEVASTVPIVYGTAYYALVNIAHLCAGESILIHAAAGGVGQAAIQLAQMIGAEVFATVGSVQKKDFLVKEFNLDASRILFSRDTSFARNIKVATQGKGVDVVLNSLAGDALQATWDCLAHFGRFVEIGKKDIVGNHRLEMAPFAYNATFASLDLTVLAAERPHMMKKLMSDVFSLFDRGILRPISPLTLVSMSDIESAFRTLQTGKGMGKMVVVPGAEDKVKAVPPKIKDAFFRSDASYVIVGGTGGIGRSITRYMVRNGARNIVLISRSGQVGHSVQELISDMTARGANIVAHKCDVSLKEDIEGLVADISEGMAPIRGVIHAAMVLQDALFEHSTFLNFTSVLAPKVTGCWNLHNSLLQHPLDFFITLSSVSGIVGNRGQAAYAAANTFLDAFANYRNAQGLPGTSIDLTAVEEIGYVAENSDTAALLDNVFGDRGINEAEVLALITAAVTGKMASCNNHCITGLKIQSESQRGNFWISDPKFSHLRAALAATEKSRPAVSLTQRLNTARTLEGAAKFVLEALTAKISTVIMVPIEDMSAEQPVPSFGMDSLVLIEVRNWITRELEAGFQILELMTAPSLRELTGTILRKSRMEVCRKLVTAEEGAQKS